MGKREEGKGREEKGKGKSSRCEIQMDGLYEGKCKGAIGLGR
jgi:hypothetical protein